jgi:hypothetical protein
MGAAGQPACLDATSRTLSLARARVWLNIDMFVPAPQSRPLADSGAARDSVSGYGARIAVITDSIERMVNLSQDTRVQHLTEHGRPGSGSSQPLAHVKQFGLICCIRN